MCSADIQINSFAQTRTTAQHALWHHSPSFIPLARSRTIPAQSMPARSALLRYGSNATRSGSSLIPYSHFVPGSFTRGYTMSPSPSPLTRIPLASLTMSRCFPLNYSIDQPSALTRPAGDWRLAAEAGTKRSALTSALGFCKTQFRRCWLYHE
jgi:hypothetical protein